MLEVFSVLDLVLWGSKCFDTTKRIFHVGDRIVPPIYLIPIVLQKMLTLPKPNKELKLPEEDAITSNNGGPKKLLTYFIDSSSGVKDHAY